MESPATKEKKKSRKRAIKQQQQDSHTTVDAITSTGEGTASAGQPAISTGEDATATATTATVVKVTSPKKKKRTKKINTSASKPDEDHQEPATTTPPLVSSIGTATSPSSPSPAATSTASSSASSGDPAIPIAITNAASPSSSSSSPQGPSSPLSPRKGSAGTVKDTSEALASPRGGPSAGSTFGRKRSDTILPNFEEVLDVADEEGLTDDQIYISKVLRGIRKGAVYGETLSKLKRDDKELERMREEEREAAPVDGFIRRDYKDKVMFKFNSPTPAGSRIPLIKKDKVVVMTDYAPKVFHHIRKRCNVATEDYLKSWTYAKENLPSPNLGAGRSGSLFVSSSDARFIFKTLPDHEVETLLEILPAIHQHFVEHPESRIIRFLGLHHFHDTITKEETYCIVMNNLLLHPAYSTIDEKWDLKGRIPKPGKEGRFADKVDRSKKVLKDNDLLDRRFYLTEESRDQLLKTLYNDVEFLKTHNCMDYSLLVGVHFLKDSEAEVAEHEKAEQKAKEEKKKGKKGKKGKKKSKKTTAEKEEREIENGEPLMLEGVMDPIYSNPVMKKEVYFVGIIDPLSRYKLRKKVAHFLKEIIWDADTLSTVPADYYAERYSKYLSEIFLSRKLEDIMAEAASKVEEAAVEDKEKAAKSESEEAERKGSKKDKKISNAKIEGEEVAAPVVKEDGEDAIKLTKESVNEKEAEVKVGEKKDSTLKRKKRAAKKAAAEAEAKANGVTVAPSTENGTIASVSTPPSEQPVPVPVLGQPAPEVEIKIEGPKKKGKKKKAEN